MNTVLFEDSINIESVQELIERLSVDVPTDLFFCTEGGVVKDMNALIHHLNKMEELTVYLTGEVASCGTFLLLTCKHPIKITEDLVAMTFHQIDIMSYNLRQTSVEKGIVKMCKEDNDQIANSFLTAGILTPKQVKEFNRGKDVTILRNELKKLKYFENSCE